MPVEKSSGPGRLRLCHSGQPHATTSQPRALVCDSWRGACPSSSTPDPPPEERRKGPLVWIRDQPVERSLFRRRQLLFPARLLQQVEMRSLSNIRVHRL